jgi:hypothetical protein
VADTTIKVSRETRDRLALLASERGLTMRDLVEQIARSMPTTTELEQHQTAAAIYVRDHLRPSFDARDIEEGERIWQRLESGQPVTGTGSGTGGQAA